MHELVTRGHRVTYTNDPFVADRIESTGAELVPCTSRLPVADNDWPADPISAASLFLDDAVQALPQLRAAYDDDPADLYLYDIGAYAARALAEAQGRPLVQLSPTFVGWDGYQEEVAAHLRKLPGADAYRDRFGRWLAGGGATTTDVDTFSGPPAKALALIPRAMQPHADRVDTGTVTFVGTCFGSRAVTDGWTRPAAAEHVLLISLGSAYTRRPTFYRQCIAAFGDLPGRHVVLQIGKHTDPEELGTVPPNVEVRSWVPQRTILEQTDALPQGAEQFMNADRLVELGVARRVDTAHATAETLRAALNDLLTDPERINRSKQLQAAAQAEGGTRRAADLIENILPAAESRPVF
ncbi:glycosyl transferase [Streptomyces luteoverticillatus]|uniref:Glycosyl transferase n=1 Tax=Streptomyces luteoverticillatus TaxID=66425 RepID=A0A3Q9G462_STRLT|nr:glycosyl transferase [Streptomyces luteoverticillatus]AZQ75044.1 glycosyl transferase [Streptomyces luteoverticillatus]